MKYRIALYRSEEGHAVSVPVLPGCWSQGATEQEALQSGLCYRGSTVQRAAAVAQKTPVCRMECLKAADNELNAGIEKGIIHDS